MSTNTTAPAATETDKVESKDVVPAETNTQLTREERKANRDAAHKLANENNPNKAPNNLFTTKSSVVEAKENPEAVAVFKQQIDAYVAKSGKGKGEGKDVEIATIGLQSAIRNLLKMRGNTLSECFTYLYKAGKSGTTAFLTPFPMRFATKITGESERVAYAHFMNLMCRYMRLNNPASIHSVVDVQLSLAFIKDKDQLAAITKMFAK